MNGMPRQQFCPSTLFMLRAGASAGLRATWGWPELGEPIDRSCSRPQEPFQVST